MRKFTVTVFILSVIFSGCAKPPVKESGTDMVVNRIVPGNYTANLELNLNMDDFTILGAVTGKGSALEVFNGNTFVFIAEKQLAFFGDESTIFGFTMKEGKSSSVSFGKAEELAARAALYNAMLAYPSADFIIFPHFSFDYERAVEYDSQGSAVICYTNKITATVYGKAIQLKGTPAGN
ncbi:MAG: hypothetical protein HPY53_12965 [Brevinematales bacterium]|nr:hypothetical protein [Brevinematales bacterium]